MANKAHKATSETREVVSALAGFGVKQVDIARYIGIQDKTLRKYYEEELANGTTKANAEVAAALYRKATEKDDTTAQIFWLKTRARWSERLELDHSSADGTMSPTVIEIVPGQLK